MALFVSGVEAYGWGSMDETRVMLLGGVVGAVLFTLLAGPALGSAAVLMAIGGGVFGAMTAGAWWLSAPRG
jgi:hypothetical protein